MADKTIQPEGEIERVKLIYFSENINVLHMVIDNTMSLRIQILRLFEQIFPYDDE
jgi:hypothetical protein